MEHSPPKSGPAPFITFYSFKGGVGRSMAVINVASLMAARGFRVLVMDMDLEAPGASFLLQRSARQQPPESLLGFVDLLGEGQTKGADADMGVLTPEQIVEKYTHPFAGFSVPDDFVKNPGGSLRIMPAGHQGTDYARRLEGLDLPGLYRQGAGQPLMDAFKKIIVNSGAFDYVLIDSRTGFSDESGVCTRDLADRLVVLTGLNHQNIQGTAAFFRALRACTDGNMPIQVVLSPVPQGEDELVTQREEEAKGLFAEAWGKPLDLSLQIPYHPRLALTEEPYSSRRIHSEIRNAYRSIEAKLLQDLGMTAQRFVTEASVAIDVKQYDLALHKLQLAINLDGGRQALAQIGFKLLQPFRKEPIARPLYKLLAEHLPVDSGLLDALGEELYNARDELCGIAVERLAVEFPQNAQHLGNYALFLTYVQKDETKAEKHYQKALEIDPNDVTYLGSYANFLAEIRPNEIEAEKYYLKALEIDPTNANFLGNYAMLLFAQGQLSTGRKFLVRAFAEDERLFTPALLSELHFYAYAHLWADYPEALCELKKSLKNGGYSPGWRLERNVEQARVQGHPNADLVAVLAQVIAKHAPLETLDAFPEWQKA